MRSYLDIDVQNEAERRLHENKPLEDLHLLALAQVLANQFYAAHGYMASSDYCFKGSSHPQECLMWEMGLQAVGYMRNCDMQSVLEEYESE